MAATQSVAPTNTTPSAASSTISIASGAVASFGLYVPTGSGEVPPDATAQIRAQTPGDEVVIGTINGRSVVQVAGPIDVKVVLTNAGRATVGIWQAL